MLRLILTISGSFCRKTVRLFAVVSVSLQPMFYCVDVLSCRRFVVSTFCDSTFCKSTFCDSTFCISTFCMSTLLCRRIGAGAVRAGAAKLPEPEPHENDAAPQHCGQSQGFRIYCRSRPYLRC
jgi:hypothetical protein